MGPTIQQRHVQHRPGCRCLCFWSQLSRCLGDSDTGFRRRGCGERFGSTRRCCRRVQQRCSDNRPGDAVQRAAVGFGSDLGSHTIAVAHLSGLCVRRPRHGQPVPGGRHISQADHLLAEAGRVDEHIQARNGLRLAGDCRLSAQFHAYSVRRPDRHFHDRTWGGMLVDRTPVDHGEPNSEDYKLDSSDRHSLASRLRLVRVATRNHERAI